MLRRVQSKNTTRLGWLDPPGELFTVILMFYHTYDIALQYCIEKVITPGPDASAKHTWELK